MSKRKRPVLTIDQFEYKLAEFLNKQKLPNAIVAGTMARLLIKAIDRFMCGKDENGALKLSALAGLLFELEASMDAEMIRHALENIEEISK